MDSENGLKESLIDRGGNREFNEFPREGKTELQ